MNAKPLASWTQSRLFHSCGMEKTKIRVQNLSGRKISIKKKALDSYLKALEGYDLGEDEQEEMDHHQSYKPVAQAR